MQAQAPKTTYLKDYTPPDYRLDTVDLHFNLEANATFVRSTLAFAATYDVNDGLRPLVLDGHDVILRSIAVDGKALTPDQYRVDDTSLTLVEPPASFVLEIETEINPGANTSLEGLYLSNGMFCTQCEAQGFRRITYFPDRPDVMAVYTTTLEADKTSYPVLLSNGNPVARGDAPGNRHWVKWNDPYKKPSYLFAMVAGDLVRCEDSFVTRSGRPVKLELYVEQQNADKCDHALNSLKKAMQWDEEVYGREYDLDIYMIVAVDHFNMGAMENKGLNVFNSACVLANPATATDQDYISIQGIIGHEYFHNWTGNRITCRDWFQLSLKEGLTVFRDQEFTADMYSRAVKRIADVNILRTRQFSEDAGPMAHPVRPDSYIDISNFYTVTIYNKGAEVLRMMHTLLGKDGFRKGMDLYFERHDGEAVTTEDFVRVMEDANDRDLGQFRRWYTQAGTPTLTVTRHHDAATGEYTLNIQQNCPPTPGQPDKAPFHVPIAVGLLNREGGEAPLRLVGETVATGGTRVLELREPQQAFRFADVGAAPIPSLLRGFSAPVKLQIDYSDEELMFLMANDTDEFARWEAGQQLAVRVIQRLMADVQQGRPMALADGFIAAVRNVLEADDLDQAFMAQALHLPNELYLAEQQASVDPAAIHEARDFVVHGLASHLEDVFHRVYEANQGVGVYRFERQEVARRSLKNLCLYYLMTLQTEHARRMARDQFYGADNMTDVLAALAALANADCPERTEVLAAFYDKWQHDRLVVDKWFAIQSGAQLEGTLHEVERLMEHPAFDIKNPNNVRAVLGTFCLGNPARFHDSSGAGYVLAADQVIRLNAINPQMSARLAASLSLWRRFDEHRQGLMREQLERVLREPRLAKDVYEVVSKSLG